MEKEKEIKIKWHPDELPEGLTEEEVIENTKNTINFFKEISKIPKVQKLMETYRVAIVKPPKTVDENIDLFKKYSLYVVDVFEDETENN